MFRRNLLFIFVVCAAGIAHSQSGLIRGRLLDSGGNPVANADVYSMFFLHCDIPNETAKLKIESGAEDGCLSMWDGSVDATTDEVGDFVLRELQWGVYELAAQKPEDGYRSTFRNLFTGEPPIRVVLTPDSPYADLTLHFPPKCALLAGTVRNAKTGELLSGVTLVMSPKDGHGWREFTGAIVPMHVLIPSEREFTLEISAAGFDAWVYRDLFDEISVSDAPAILKLRAGEQVSLDIALTPKANRRQLTVPQSKSR
jgi:hypothetical protein